MLMRTFSRSLLRRDRFIFEPVSHAVCIDIECTCDSPVQIHPMEVIEIACLKLDLTTNPNAQNDPRQRAETTGSRRLHIREIDLERCPRFHSFVKPLINPDLTLFCQELTGVLQSTVDKAEPIEKVVDNLLVWLKEQSLVDTDYNPKKNFAFASCGNFDLNLLSPIVKKCKFNGNRELPIYFKEWINVKKTFLNHKKEWPKGLYHMLEILGEEPSGRLHSAEDDCRNLARIVEYLQMEGCKFHITSRSS